MYILCMQAAKDPGYLERGFICTCIKVWGFRFADFISFFLNIPPPPPKKKKRNNLVSLTKLLHFNRIFKNGERGEG